MFWNKEKNISKTNALANALAKTDNTNNYYNHQSPYNATNSNFGGEYQGADNSQSLSGLINTGKNAYSAFQNFGGGDTLYGSVSATGGMEGGKGGGGSSVPWGAIGAGAKSFYNGYTGQDDSDYSDLEESVIYPLQGASTGASLGGGWGALGGALYGLGYSFKDDLGLDDNEWYTDLIFPIGMGDEHQGLIQL